MTQAHNTSHVEKRFQILGALLLVGGLALVGAGFTQGGMEGLAKSYLYGWVMMMSIVFGCFSLSLLFHITRGRWGTPLLRIFEAGGGPVAIGFCLVAFLPIAFVFKDTLYGPWLHADPHDLVVARKSHFLNYPVFLGSTIGTHLLFMWMAWLLQKWTKQEEKTGDKVYSDRRNNFASPFMVVYFLVFTFFITHIIMSLDPHWYSTIFPSIFAVANALFAFAFAVVVVTSNRNKDPFQKVAGDQLFMKDFANLLLMLTMVWTYFTFSQLLIIWSGNLPNLTSYYRARMTGNYGVLGFFQLMFNFAAPFVALLNVFVKRKPAYTMLVAGFIVVFRFTDLHYVVMPFLRPELGLHLADAGCALALLGAWGLQFAGVYRSANPIVASHPYQTFAPAEVPAHA